jgi:regulator of sirC expression with transglutaminase-like and TPR domain
MLYRALELASSRGPGEALALLNRTIGQSPRFWQAFQCRAELHLAQQAPTLALADVSTAILLAPAEAHLYRLRAHIYALLEEPASSAADLERAAQLE